MLFQYFINYNLQHGWLKLDPLNNPSAPAGPIFMAEYTNRQPPGVCKARRESEKPLRERRKYAGNRRPVRDGHRSPGDRAALDRAQPTLRDSSAADSGSGRGVRSANHEHVLDRNVSESLEPLPARSECKGGCAGLCDASCPDRPAIFHAEQAMAYFSCVFNFEQTADFWLFIFVSPKALGAGVSCLVRHVAQAVRRSLLLK
jgi:hypothetical protein